WRPVRPAQYRKLKLGREGKFSPGRKPKFPPLERMDPDEQVEALQRAALEPCVGGAFYPGIEAPWIVGDKDLYVHAFRINSKTHGPGDITKYMCVPWQADFYDCKNNWWPAARPDDVISQDAFEEANKAWHPGQPRISEALEAPVKWDRGLECAHDGGQVVGWELTGAAGLSKDGSHGQAPHLQHRIQASGRSRIHCRRDPAYAGEASRSLPQSDPHLGGQVRSGDL